MNCRRKYDFILNRPGSPLALLSSLLILLVLVSCQSDDQPSFSDLSEEERHNPEHALAGIEVRDGLEISLFASEDMVVNPTNMDIDDRGRVWITEGFNYRPDLNPPMAQREEGDRIVILEDTTGDGAADTETVFYQGPEIDAALGIMVLGNSVYVSRSPHVFVFTDTTGDDRADVKEILFSGIGGEQHDHGVHAFVFGPDGQLYFNTGDAGEQIHDKNGELIVDKSGNPVRTDGNPYRKGMVFRTPLDGSEFEVLGHNFRNNYEVAVDSYGTLWQSDNDDDGNRSVRINYVMEFGNYGYTDEMTGAGWRSGRMNMEEEVHEQHWYQNDPGVIPNLLDTGAGSPTGILFYEGDLLPDVFHNQMIHADAGPNVVRAYPVEKSGAGYSATIEEIMRGVDNQWVRPSDVTVAPDGSIFIADWYDPGVGGHQVRSKERGRIYRIAPGNSPYRVPEVDYSTPEQAVDALKSPNHATRSNAWLKLHEWGSAAESVLNELWSSDAPPHLRARALWLLSKLENGGEDYVLQALEDQNSDLRITALRAARQLDIDLIPILDRLTDDPSPQVRREAALALRHHESVEAPRLWAELAEQYDGEDRWYLEALGIGADRQWDRYFTAWMDLRGGEWNDEAGRDIVWRARTDQALPLLAEIIVDPSVSVDDKPAYFRAFDFHTSPEKEGILLGLLNTDQADREWVTFLTLQMFDASAPERLPAVQNALDRSLEEFAGTEEFLDLVSHFELEDRQQELGEILLANYDNDLGSESARLLLQSGGEDYLAGILLSSERATTEGIITVLGSLNTNQSLNLLQLVVTDSNHDFETRRMAVEAFGSGSFQAENRLLTIARDGDVPPELRVAVSNVLMRSGRETVRNETATLLQASAPEQINTDHRPVSELAQLQGNSDEGREVYQRMCQMCHVAGDEGIRFGPELTEIGDKLPKEGLYNSILEPSAGINFGYEGFILTLSDDTQVTGIIESETDTELLLLLPGGVSQSYSPSEIVNRQQMEQSLMPALQAGMSEQDLVNLVEYLSTLRNN